MPEDLSVSNSLREVTSRDDLLSVSSDLLEDAVAELAYIRCTFTMEAYKELGEMEQRGLCLILDNFEQRLLEARSKIVMAQGRL